MSSQPSRLYQGDEREETRTLSNSSNNNDGGGDDDDDQKALTMMKIMKGLPV